MNGVHDMGGMQGFGPINPETNEPVFHLPWEGRVYAMNLSMFAWQKWNLDAARFGIESLPPADYIGMSYYQKWHTALAGRMINSGMVTQDEIDKGRAVEGTTKTVPPLIAANVEAFVSGGGSYRRNENVPARFRTSQRVRAKNINPPGHTRLPRYARGKIGMVTRDYGVFVFPDTNAEFKGEKPQHLYSVRFAARELWGDQAKPKDTVMIDMWDDYLEAA
jgi:nitrile hydratase subunit beta